MPVTLKSSKEPEYLVPKHETNWILIGFVLFLFAMGVNNYLTMPHVYQNPYGECTAVYIEGQVKPCEFKPDRYETVTVPEGTTFDDVEKMLK